MILDDLLERAAEAETHVATDVRVGLGYTAVRLDDGRCGVAYSFADELARDSCSALRQAGTLSGRQVGELLAWSRAEDALSAAIGIATVNAVLAPAAGGTDDARQVLDVGAGDRVGMVGHLRPLVETCRDAGAEVRVLERSGASGCLPDWLAPEVLPGCDVVALSATSLIIRTLDRLLELAAGAREIAVVGPSTPLVPEVFACRGVSLLSGVRVVDADQVLRTVSEGGGTRHFGDAVAKVSLRPRPLA